MTAYSRTRLALLQRAERAVMNLYHAATPSYPRDFGPYADSFSDWLGDAGLHEIQHLNDGGTYGRDYVRTLNHSANAGRFKSEAARRYYVRRELRRQRLDYAKGAAVDRVADMFGELYSWGRGGRTIAPDTLVHQRGGSSFSLSAELLDDWSAAKLTEGVQVLEAFGDFVESWNRGVPDMWRDYTLDRAAEESALAAARLSEGRTVVATMLADLRKIRREGISAPAVCAAMQRVIRAELASMREARRTVRQLAPVLP